MGIEHLLAEAGLGALLDGGRLPAPLRAIAPPPGPPLRISQLGDFTWRVNHLLGWAVDGPFLFVCHPDLFVVYKVRLCTAEVVCQSGASYREHDLRYPQGLAVMAATGEVMV
jgi:hypothetical protein